jgi:ABC-type uncharacterized transport system substrate-binding protein
MRRRRFITLLGGAAAWPLAARAQQPSMPVVGFLSTTSPESYGDRLRGFRQGLKENGFVEGENIAITYRWAENRFDRLPELADDLVRRQVALIVAGGGTPAALNAKAATATIPVVFGVAQDPVRLGLVASMSRPGGNVTGVNFFNSELSAKRLELLRAMAPAASRVAVLVNPATPFNTEAQLRDVETAAHAMKLQIQVFNARTPQEIDAVFAMLTRERPDALFVGGDTFFTSRRVQLANQTVRHGVPTTFSLRDYAEAGGLMSYGTSLTDAYRQMGVYAGRILKGVKPTELPVVQAAKFELVINHQTARIIGLTVPDKLLVAADEVIE